MTKKCDSCKHRTESDMGLLGTAVRCSNRTILEIAYKTAGPAADMPLTYAREICNKEGDGIFVYFEPKTPAAGASFGESRSEFERDRMGQTGQDNAEAMKAAA